MAGYNRPDEAITRAHGSFKGLEMKNVVIPLAAAFALSGCSTEPVITPRAPLEITTTTLAIYPGHKMQVNQREAAVYGTSACPPGDSTEVTRILFWPDPEAPLLSCISIDRNTRSVAARLEFADRPVNETLSVKLSGDQIMLFRADGTMLTPVLTRDDLVVREMYD